MGSSALAQRMTTEPLPPAVVWPPAIVSAMDMVDEANDSSLDRMLEGIVNGDREAFASLYDATNDRVLSIVLRITQKMEVAEEVVGDVYLQVWRQADRFDAARGNALAWLTVISRSRALDAVRKYGSAPTSYASPIEDEEEPECCDYPQDLLMAAEEHSALHVALEKIEPGQRQLLALAYFRGYSHGELAQFTGLPLGTVKTQLRRTLSKLKDLMIASDIQERVSA